MNTVEKQSYCKEIVDAIEAVLAKGISDLSQDEALAYGCWKTPTTKIASLSVLKVAEGHFTMTVRLCDETTSHCHSSFTSEIHRMLLDAGRAMTVSYLRGDTGLVVDYLMK